MNQFPFEVEANFGNRCGLKCGICSPFHGCGNIPLMPPDVFERIVSQLRDVDFEVLQTSGNGDAFMNPDFIHYLRVLRKTFPTVFINFYSNFVLFGQCETNIITGEKLLDHVHIRIDSLSPIIANRVTGSRTLDIILRNVNYFMSRNRGIKFEVMYNHVPSYYKRCWEVMGKKPLYLPFTDSEVAAIPDEYRKIKNYFGNENVCYSRMGHSLWAERTQALPDPVTSCPKLAQFESIIWINPSGNIDICGYDDLQSVFIAGDTAEEHILKIWNGERRRGIIKKIRNREYKKYPCVNPRCCQMVFYGNN